MPVVKLAACLIVRDSESVLRSALDSIYQHVDEIVICDTGSTDGTIEMVENYNGPQAPVKFSENRPEIRVVNFDWCEDFSAARQASFDAVSDDVTHIVWMDDDDEIEGAQHLRQLAAQIPPGVAGTVCYYDYSRDEAGNCNCELWRERILRRDAGYVWQGAVHETLAPPDGGTPQFEMVPKEVIRWVHHRERAGDRYVPDRNLRILKASLQKQIDAGELVDPRTLAYLGTENMARGEWTAAIPYLMDYLRHPGGWSDERMQIAHKLSTCLRFTGQVHAAVEVEFEAMRERDDWSETAVGLAEAFCMLGDWKRTKHWARIALDLGKPTSVLILNPQEFTLLPLIRLAQASMQMFQWDEAEKAIRNAEIVASGNPMVVEMRGVLETSKVEHGLVTAVLQLREMLCRSDENLKALQVLQSAPYQIAEHPAIVQALRDQQKMIAHATDEKAYDAFYREDDKTSTVPDDIIPHIGEMLPRAGRLLDGLKAQEEMLGRKPRIIDLGCNDWWLGQFLWDEGFVCDGVELNVQSYEIAKRRIDAIENSTDVPEDVIPPYVEHGNIFDVPKTFTKGYYDAVSLFEVIEHVPDPTRLLEVCEWLLGPKGVVYLTTPNGSYDRGNTPGALDPTRKQHLRAIPMSELARMIAPRGVVAALEEHHEGRVAFGAYTPMRKRGKVVIYGGQSVEQWTPAQAKQGGIGGSETALVQVASRLADRGFNVEVFSDAEPGLWAGAIWRPRHMWDPSEYADATIISRTPAAFDHEINSPVRALWCHDQAYPDMTPHRAENLTHLIVLSEWQKDWASKIYPDVDQAKHYLLRNGIPGPVADTVPTFSERNPVVAYSSAPDRGLRVLLNLWPAIRKAVPDAELRIFYGWDVFDRVAIWQPSLQAYKAEILAMIERLGGEAGGIVWRGRIGQDDLAQEFQHARVLGYPASFRETSCITAMECRAAGLPIVTSRLAALTHTVGKHGILIDIPGDDDSPGMNANEEAVAAGPYGERFLAEVTRLLADEAYWSKWSAKGRQGSKALTWEARIPEWERLVLSGRATRRKAAA